MPALVRAQHATWLLRFEETCSVDLIPVFCSGAEQVEKVQLWCWHILIWLRCCFLCEQRQPSLPRWLRSKEVARAGRQRSEIGLFSKPGICHWQHIGSWAQEKTCSEKAARALYKWEFEGYQFKSGQPGHLPFLTINKTWTHSLCFILALIWSFLMGSIWNGKQ